MDATIANCAKEKNRKKKYVFRHRYLDNYLVESKESGGETK